MALLTAQEIADALTLGLGFDIESVVGDGTTTVTVQLTAEEISQLQNGYYVTIAGTADYNTTSPKPITISDSTHFTFDAGKTVPNTNESVENAEVNEGPGDFDPIAAEYVG